MKTLVTAFFVSLSLAGNAWGQSPRLQTAADLAKYLGADRERLLYEGAKKEAKLVWYTSLTPYKEIARSFESRYPGVTVEPYRAPATNLATRILGEAQARRYIADTIETTQGALMLLRDNKLLLPYTTPYLGDYPEGSKEKAPGGLFFTAVDRESYPGIGYSINAIREPDVAKSFDDLLKPALKRKIGISGEEIGNRVIGAILKAKGEGFIKRSAAQDIKMYGLPAVGLTEFIVCAEALIRFAGVDSNVVSLAAARGAPVAWLAPDLVPVNSGSVAVLTHTQHPHAALLFIDFLIGPEGQKLFSDKLGYGTARKPSGFKRWYPEQGLTSYDYAETIERWSKILLEISRK